MNRKLSHEELLKRQATQETPKLPFCVVLDGIRSLYNVGSIFRTADAVGIEKLWLCGITGMPPDPKISKTALDAQEVVAWEYVQEVRECLENLKKQGYEIIFLEQTTESVSYEAFEPSGPLCLVLGNEVYGIRDEILPFCDRAIEIPMSGIKNSLNVTVAFGVVAYQIRQKLLRS